MSISILYKLTLTTRSSAISEVPRDALCQLKSCHVLHNCIKISFEKAGSAPVIYLLKSSRSSELPLFR